MKQIESIDYIIKSWQETTPTTKNNENCIKRRILHINIDGNPNIDIKFTVKKLVQSPVPWETNTRRASTSKVRSESIREEL